MSDDTQDIGPNSPAAQQAYRRLHKAIGSLDKLGLLPSSAADLRYGQELTSELYGSLVRVLVGKGVITERELCLATLEGLNERAATFEARVFARLDGQKDMPT